MNNRAHNGKAGIDAKIERAAARLIDDVLNTVVQGVRQGTLVRVAELSRESLQLRLIKAADPLLLEKCDGAELADEIINDVIRVLRRKLPDQSTQTLELLLADVRVEAVRKLGEFADGLIDSGPFIDEVVNKLSDEATAVKLNLGGAP